MTNTVKKSPEKATAKPASNLKAVKQKGSEKESFESVSESIILIGRKIRRCQNLKTHRERLVEYFAKDLPEKPKVTFSDETTRYNSELSIQDEDFFKSLSAFVLKEMQTIISQLENEIVNDKKNLAA